MTDENWYVQVGKLYSVERSCSVFSARGLIQLAYAELVVVVSIKPYGDGCWVRLLTPCGRVGGKYCDRYEMSVPYFLYLLKNP
jgi:hypothetical protein